MNLFQIFIILRDFLISHHPGVLELHPDIFLEPHIFKELDKDAQEGILSQLKEFLDRKEEEEAETEASIHNQISLSYPLIYKVRNSDDLKPLHLSHKLNNLFIEYCNSNILFLFLTFHQWLWKQTLQKLEICLWKQKSQALSKFV